MPRKTSQVIYRSEQTGVANDFRNRPAVDRHDGTAAGHRFKYAEAEGLNRAGVYRTGRSVICAPQLGWAQLT